MTNTTLKKTMFGNKKMALAFLAVLAAFLFFALSFGTKDAQAATSANTAKESASATKKLSLLEKMKNEPDEKTVTVGKTDLKSELGVTSTQAALVKASKSYAKSLLGKYGYENVSGNTYETQYPFSRIFVDGAVIGKEAKITDETSKIAVVESGVTTLQYDTPEEAALAAADFEDAGYDVYADTLDEMEEEAKSSNPSDNYEYSMMKLDSDVKGSETVIVAVLEVEGVDIDTLLAYNNGEFADRIIYEEKNGENVYYDAVEGDTTATEGGDHGTEVASTILLNTSDNIKILPVKTAYWDSKNQKWKGSTTYQQKAVEYAAENDADIVNMSYKCGDASTADTYCTAVGGYIDTAIKSGTTFVVAAANDYGEVSTYPACYEPCWTISAIDSTYTKADFSNSGDEVDFCAPGVEITVLKNNGKLTTDQGTSFASPLTAACVANLASLGGKYKTEDESCDDARYDYFKTTCMDLGDSGKDVKYGYGMVMMEAYNLENAEITFNNSSVAKSGLTYTGKERTPAITVTIGACELLEGTHYSVSYSNNTDAGEATVTITGIEEYKCIGTNTATFTINPKSLKSTTTASLSQTKYTYDGTAHTPSVTCVKSCIGGTYTTITKNKDYTVSYSNNVNAGTATVTITGKGNFTDYKTKTFTIEKLNLEDCDVSFTGSTNYTYDGTAKTPSIMVEDEDGCIIGSGNYTVSYTDNVDAGTATVTVTGRNNCTGSSSKDFTINQRSISAASISVPSVYYNGTARKPGITATYKGSTLVSGTDYTISSYSDNINPSSSAKITIKGTGNFTGTTTKAFTINKLDLSKATVTLSKTAYGYDGTKKKPTVTVKYDGATISSKYYSVTYSDNCAGSKYAKITATAAISPTTAGKSYCTGSKSANYKILNKTTIIFESNYLEYNINKKEQTIYYTFDLTSTNSGYQLSLIFAEPSNACALFYCTNSVDGSGSTRYYFNTVYNKDALAALDGKVLYTIWSNYNYNS